MNNPAQTKRLKHVQTREFFTREKIQSGEIEVVKIDTKYPSVVNPRDGAEAVARAARKVLGHHRAVDMDRELEPPRRASESHF